MTPVADIKVYSHLNECWKTADADTMKLILEAHNAPDWKLEHTLWSHYCEEFKDTPECRHKARRMYLVTPALRTIYELLLKGI